MFVLYKPLSLNTFESNLSETNSYSVKKFGFFCGTRKFMTLLTKTRPRTLSSAGD